MKRLCSFETNDNKSKNTWIRKTNYKAYVSFISLKAYTNDFWYFDSSCFRHMIGDRSDLISYQEVSRENGTFADGVKSHVLGKGTLNMKGFPKVDNVLHVENLQANLLIKFMIMTCLSTLKGINVVFSLLMKINFERISIILSLLLID